jgi:hypothetical protein
MLLAQGVPHRVVMEVLGHSAQQALAGMDALLADDD